MVRISPQYKFELGNVPADINIVVGNRTFPAHRLVLISQSDYFRNLLTGNFKEAQSSNITLKDTDSEIFELILKSIYGVKFEIPDLETALHYLLLLNFFQIRGIDIQKLGKDLYVTPEEFPLFIEYMKYISGELDPDFIASKAQLNTDLSILPEELQKKIRISPEWRYHGPNKAFIQQLYDLAHENMDQPVKYYIHEQYLTQAHSFPEAILNFDRAIYRDMIEGWNIDLSGDPVLSRRITEYIPSLDGPVPALTNNYEIVYKTSEQKIPLETFEQMNYIPISKYYFEYIDNKHDIENDPVTNDELLEYLYHANYNLDDQGIYERELV